MFAELCGDVPKWMENFIQKNTRPFKKKTHSEKLGIEARSLTKKVGNWQHNPAGIHRDRKFSFNPIKLCIFKPLKIQES